MNVDARTVDDWTAFFYAVFNGNTETINFLGHEAKVQVNLVDRFKRNPAHWAARYDMVRVIEAISLMKVPLDT